MTSGALFVYYEEIKQELQRIPIHEYRCNERLKAEAEGSALLTYTTGTPKDRDEVKRREV